MALARSRGGLTRLAQKQGKNGKAGSHGLFLHGFDSRPTVSSGKAGGEMKSPVEMV